MATQGQGLGKEVIGVDTNVVAYFVIAGEHTGAAEALRARDSHWIVPALFRHELLSVVVMSFMAGRLSKDEAIRAYRRGVSLVSVDEAPIDPIEIIELHRRSDCSSYDCEFVSVAIHRRIKLATFDKKLLRAFPDVATDLNSYLRT